MADKSDIATAYGFLSLALLAVGLFLGYEGTIYWQLSPTQWNEAIVGAVLVVIALYAIHEYLHL